MKVNCAQRWVGVGELIGKVYRIVLTQLCRFIRHGWLFRPVARRCSLRLQRVPPQTHGNFGSNSRFVHPDARSEAPEGEGGFIGSFLRGGGSREARS